MTAQIYTFMPNTINNQVAVQTMNKCNVAVIRVFELRGISGSVYAGERNNHYNTHELSILWRYTVIHGEISLQSSLQYVSINQLGATTAHFDTMKALLLLHDIFSFHLDSIMNYKFISCGGFCHDCLRIAKPADLLSRVIT